MLLAIPTRNDRVSPVFDTACRLLLVEVEQGQERARRTEELSDTLPAPRVRRLRELGVEVLVCGGISRGFAAMLEAAGIRVVSWIAGPVDDVLRAYLEGRLSHPRWMMPGCQGRQRHQGCQGAAGDGRAAEPARPQGRGGCPRRARAAADSAQEEEA